MVKTCGISGGSGAGKTTLTRHLVERLGTDQVSVVAFDAYYRDQGHLSPADRALVNYDHPSSLDHEMFAADVQALRSGRAVAAPVYDFATHTRTGEVVMIEPKPVVIVEGILLLSFSEIAAHLDLAVFIDVPEAVRLERRIIRDVAERGREPDDVRRQFAATVAPMHNQYVEPYRHLAPRTVELHESYGPVADELVERLSVRERLVG
ncbi:MAG: uridine kinase [Ilumatobacteraceae bacterium]